MSLKTLAAKGVKGLLKQDRTILTGVSIASSVMAVIFAWNARPKVERLKEELDARGADKAERAKEYAKALAPTGIALGVSVGSKLVEFKRTGEKLSSLVNAVSTYKTIDDIRRDVEKEELTEDKIKAIDEKVAERRIKSASPEEIEETGHGDTVFIEPEYTGKVWHGSKDYWDLGIAKLNGKLMGCYDKYTGLCRKDDFAIDFWDIFKEQGLRTADFYRSLTFPARDFKQLPVSLEPIEYEGKDGKTELGYKVVFDARPVMAYDDRNLNYG